MKTPAVREVNGFKLYDRVSYIGVDGQRVTGYITGLRSRGEFEISDVEGHRLADKDWRKLALEQPAYRNRLIEERSIVGDSGSLGCVAGERPGRTRLCNAAPAVEAEAHVAGV
ncbi:MAG: hypothetical protein ACPLRW_08875 [Moorellales bacterium]